MFLLCLSSLDVREGVHSSRVPETTVKDPALTDPTPQGSRLQADLTLAVRGPINDRDVVHKCEML